MKQQRGNSLRYFKFCVRREFLFTNYKSGSLCPIGSSCPEQKKNGVKAVF